MDSTQLEQAQSLYLQSEYAAANDINLELAESELQSNPFLSVNIANAYFQQQDYGQALYYYYQAKSQIPRNQELNSNLNLAINQIELSQPPLLSYSYMTFFEAFTLFIIFNIVFLFRKKFKHKAFLSFLAIMAFLISGANFAFIAYEQKLQDYAVVTSIATKAYSGDNEAYSELFELLDGQILEVLQKDQSWSKVKYNGALAWVQNSDLRFFYE